MLSREGSHAASCLALSFDESAILHDVTLAKAKTKLDAMLAEAAVAHCCPWAIDGLSVIKSVGNWLMADVTCA